MAIVKFISVLFIIQYSFPLQSFSENETQERRWLMHYVHCNAGHEKQKLTGR